ncbi:MAG: hypothetical protein ABR507_03940 [Actinomycetota bacterium]|nr:hypothetical protein [Actinomycetota bacterium]
MKKSIVSAVVAGLVLIAGMAAWAGTSTARESAAEGSRPTAEHSLGRGPRHAHKGHRDLRLLHADGVAMRRDGATVETRVQKGTITAIDAHAVTLRSADGFTSTYVVDADTKVHQKGKSVSFSDLRTGEMARVLAVKDGDHYVAKRIGCVGEPNDRGEADTRA